MIFGSVDPAERFKTSYAMKIIVALQWTFENTLILYVNLLSINHPFSMLKLNSLLQSPTFCTIANHPSSLSLSSSLLRRLFLQ